MAAALAWLHMQFVADLHIHSKYSRATSRECDLEGLAWWGARKGIGVIGTGDFTHPAWFAELREKLVPAEDGLYRLDPTTEEHLLGTLPRTCRNPVRFMLSVEISTIYKRDDRTRKVHHLIYMPDLDTAERFNKKLDAVGNIKSDGRPILGLDSRHLLEIVLECSSDAFLVPAHVWTPWFAVLGSQSGFDHVDDCYVDLADHVFALETGLSSDPEMNRRVSSLDKYQLVSNSDAHSPNALAREATMLDVDIGYVAIRDAFRTGEGLDGTLEFFPEEGKYHLDGHRKCGVRWEPPVTLQHGNICEGCDKPVTVGVSHRVELLADRPPDHPLPPGPSSRHIVQLPQIIGEVHGVGPKSKRVVQDVARMVDRFGPELSILLDVPIDELARDGSPLVAEAIDRLRNDQAIREGGYDGEYGVIRMFEPDELERRRVTSVLFELPAVTEQGMSTPDERPPDVRARVPSERGTSMHDEPAPGFLAERGKNAGQAAAIATLEGPLLITAGPGTGKTHTLVERFRRIVDEKEADPSACLAVTFTRRAANELRERMHHAIDVMTFHGVGLEIIRRHVELLGLPPTLRVIGDIERLALLGGDRKRANDISKHKREFSSESDHHYDSALRKHGLVDLDDLLVLPVKLLEELPGIAEQWRTRWQWIAVDEFQDIDALQYRLLRLLTTPESNLCAVGDPDQAIYGFRGGDVRFFLQFDTDFTAAKHVELVQNYRSSPAIVKAASQAIAPSSLVPGRRLEAVSVEAEAPTQVMLHRAASEGAEATFVASMIEQLMGGTSLHALDSGRAEGTPVDFHFSFNDFAILYRTDRQAQSLLDGLHRAGIPAQKRSHDRLLEHAGVARLASLLATLPPADDEQLVLPLVRTCLEQLDDEIDHGDIIELLEPLAEQCGANLQSFLNELAMGAQIDTWDPRADRVSLLTLHAAKGLEFPVVFVTGADDGLLPLRFGSQPLSSEQIAEERRLFFVGMTRARSHLHISGRSSVPSPFLKHVDKELISEHRTKRRPLANQLRLL